MYFSFGALGGRPIRRGRTLPVSLAIAFLAFRTSDSVTQRALSNGNSFIDFIKCSFSLVRFSRANQSQPFCVPYPIAAATILTERF